MNINKKKEMSGLHEIFEKLYFYTDAVSPAAYTRPSVIYSAIFFF